MTPARYRPTPPSHSGYKYLLVYLTAFVLIGVTRQTAWVEALDQAVYSWVRDLAASEAWLHFWHTVTRLGAGTVVYPLVYAVVLWFVYKNRRERSFYFFTVLSLMFLTLPLFKQLFRLPRPEALAPFMRPEASYTFPSGHAVNGVVLFYFLPQFARHVFVPSSQPRVWIRCLGGILAAIGIVAMAMSRVFLGVHWFSDVVAGILWGGIISLGALALLKRWHPLRRSSGPHLGTIES